MNAKEKSSKLLVTTALKQTWGKDRSVVFLGEWCKKYSEKDNWKSKKHTTNVWHWNDPRKIEQDYDYLAKLYEDILHKVCYKLNHIHEVNFSKRYWRVIVGPWLLTYIAVVFDRWESISVARKLQETLETIIPDQLVDRPVANNYESAMRLMTQDDEWNYLIYCNILQAQKPHNIILIKQAKIIKNIVINVNRKRKIFSFSIKKIIDFFVKKVNFNNSYKVLFYKSFFSVTALVRITIKLKELPRYYFEFDQEVQNKVLKPSFRAGLKGNSNGTEFENFLFQQVFRDIPKAYIESYKEISQYCATLPDARVNLTATEYFGNEIYKVWTAQQIEKGNKFIISEHGGAILSNMANFHHLEKICDKKIVWHMPLHASHVRLTPSKAFKKVVNFNSEKITLIGLEFPRYSYRCQSGTNGPLILDDFKQKCNLINALDGSARIDFKIRPYPDRGWSTGDRYSDIYGNAIISMNKTTYSQLYQPAH